METKKNINKNIIKKAARATAIYLYEISCLECFKICEDRECYNNIFPLIKNMNIDGIINFISKNSHLIDNKTDHYINNAKQIIAIRDKYYGKWLFTAIIPIIAAPFSIF